MRALVMRWIASLAFAALAVGLVLTTPAQAQEAVGDWHGVLKAGGVELRIGVTIRPGADGVLTGSLASPDQGTAAIPLQDIRMDQGKLIFAAPSIRGKYEGDWDAALSAWNGRWVQGGPLPLTLTKGPVPTAARPQVPQKPYPYREDEVAFDSAPGVKLAGTLTLPMGKGPFPAAVLITGSGPQDRNEALLGHQPFLVLADHLTRQGIAVLRYDDRGVAKSTGDFQAAVGADFAVDAAAAVTFLRGRKDIDPRRIGLIGHSEGGLIAPMVAAKDRKIAFVILLAGPGVAGQDLMRAQRQAIGKALGAPPAALERNEALAHKLDHLLAWTENWEAAKVEVARVIGQAAAEAGVPADQAMAANQMLFTAWYRDFLRQDPLPDLMDLRMPVLALNGSNDLQVVASQNIPALREALKGNKDATVEELPGLNHLFQHSATGAPGEYGRIEETFAPEALTRVSDWLRIRVQK